jgi:predicted DNA-binding protein (MmcQ/YjbR family)
MSDLKPLKDAVAALRKHALGFPQTIEDFPWGHSAFKVKGKKAFLFTYLNEKEGYLNLSMKLPLSGRTALIFPFAKPTEYGLGKSGWVTSQFKAQDDIPLEMLMDWIDESFRAIAPKQVVAELDGAAPAKPVNKVVKKKTKAKQK